MLAKKRRIVLRFVCITTLEGYGCAADKEIVQQVFIPKDVLPGPLLRRQCARVRPAGITWQSPRVEVS